MGAGRGGREERRLPVTIPCPGSGHLPTVCVCSLMQGKGCHTPVRGRGCWQHWGPKPYPLHVRESGRIRYDVAIAGGVATYGGEAGGE